MFAPFGGGRGTGQTSYGPRVKPEEDDALPLNPVRNHVSRNLGVSPIFAGTRVKFEEENASAGSVSHQGFFPGHLSKPIADGATAALYREWLEESEEEDGNDEILIPEPGWKLSSPIPDQGLNFNYPYQYSPIVAVEEEQRCEVCLEDVAMASFPTTNITATSEHTPNVCIDCIRE